MHKITKIIFLFSLLLILIAIVNYSTPKLENLNKRVLSITSIVTPTPYIQNLNSKCHAAYLDKNDPQAVLPDSTCTPGAINPNVTQDNLFETICKSGFTKTIRPSSSYTNKLKIEQISEYGYPNTNLKDYEEDHLISLELGGDPSSPSNLWPEPHGSPNEKDKVENYLNHQICSGVITLKDAQAKIAGNWYEIYKTLGN